jgi:hypothetical protein
VRDRWLAGDPRNPLARTLTNGTGEGWGSGASMASAEPAHQRAVVSMAVDHWINEYGRLALRSNWSDDDSSLEVLLGYQGLPGALALELASTLASPRGLYRCFGCQRAFTPDDGQQRPRSGLRAWCGLTARCDKKAQKRDWARRQRAKRGGGQ